jgi:hypothetical protein
VFIPGEGWVRWAEIARQVDRAFNEWRMRKQLELTPEGHLRAAATKSTNPEASASSKHKASPAAPTFSAG